MKTLLKFATASVLALTIASADPAAAQEPSTAGSVAQPSHSLRIPWTDGTAEDALRQAAAGSTIMMSDYKVRSTKDNKVYSGVLIGTDPFEKPPKATTLYAVVIPVKVTIGSTVFDPMAVPSCGDGTLPLIRFLLSPIVQEVKDLTLNGVNMGTMQYVSGFRRAEFWGKIDGSVDYRNDIVFQTAGTVSISPGSHGMTDGSGCKLRGIVSKDWLKDYLVNTLLPSLQNSGVISPTQLAFFLFSNVVQSKVDPPTTSDCCVLGFHSATGNPVQTYITADWDTTGRYVAQDAATASHELAEWMDDPLGTNSVPAWGGIGQEKGSDCSESWENGDPLNTTLMPVINMYGMDYHVQELAFFNWFFAKKTAKSVGTGGKFSSNGTFSGPAKACPPGGTY